MKVIRNSILFIFFLPSFLLSQEQDFMSWNNIELNYKVSKKTSLSLNNRIIFRENSSLFSKYFVDFKVKIKYNKHISYALGLRHSTIRDVYFDFDDKSYTYSDLSFKYTINKAVKATLRNRFKVNIDELESVFRQRIKLEYNLTSLPVLVINYFEYFYSREKKIQKIRYGFGVDKNISDKLKINMNYIIQRELNYENNLHAFILSSKLTYKIN
jgi:hypothetical protein